ncbi:aminotransferase A [Bacillus carboniphilus]|uniref:Aminotransferase n=1 Tax=Bacillus carboniphilus TaxID=86663 RepID=A0ABY9JUW3_9BACI|nr:aminotransferase A [Bacillus carboniphilus]WLR43180.1 aminotransferase A [Bacillus carboniphilus]
MEHTINSQVKNIQISGIRQFFNMVSQYEDVLSLTIGQPDFPTPEHIKEAAKLAIDENFTTYTANAGMLQLRQAIAQYYYDKDQLQYSPKDQIIVTNGASQGIDITFRTILSDGDEVLLPGPIYPGYEPLIKLSEAKPIYVDTTTSNFQITAEQIKPLLSNKTRCIVLPYPSNPTGVSISEEELEKIANLVKGRNIFILSDEIYSELQFSNKHLSIASFLPNQTIIINGLSKSHSMTGFRIGFLLGPAEIVQHVLKVHQYNVSCTCSISQRAALAALTNGRDDPIKMRKEYEKRLDYVYKRLIKMGMDVVKPDGAFYLFPKVPFQNMTSFQFAIDLLEKARVAVVPGSSFSLYGEGYFRLSFAYNMAQLKEALDRLESYCSSIVGP